MTAAPMEVAAWTAMGVRGLIDAPQVAVAEVVGRFPTALYVRTRDDRILGIVTRDGVALPNAVLLPVLSGAGTLGRVGDTVEVGAGRVRAPGLRVRVTGAFPTRPRLAREEVPVLLAGLDRLSRRLGRHGRDLPTEGLASALERRDAAQLPAAVADLLGVGAGLTPAGDDVLAGALSLVASAVTEVDGGPTGFARVFATAVGDRAVGRTTSLSETLLWHAAAGEMAAPARALVRCLATGRAVDRAIERLLRVGGSSGRDLALGLVLGGRALAADGHQEEAA